MIFFLSYQRLKPDKDYLVESEHRKATFLIGKEKERKIEIVCVDVFGWEREFSVGQSEAKRDSQVERG